MFRGTFGPLSVTIIGGERYGFGFEISIRGDVVTLNRGWADESQAVAEARKSVEDWAVYFENCAAEIRKSLADKKSNPK